MNTRVTPLPRMGAGTQAVQDRVVARRQDYGFRVPEVSSNAAELEGLMRGLSNFNSALGQYTEQAIRKQEEDLTSLARNEAGKQAALTDLEKVGIEDALAQDLPANVPLAYGKVYREALSGLLTERAAIRMKSDMVREYTEASKAENFDLEAFLGGWRQKALSGLNDPIAVGAMGKHLSAIEGALRVEAEKGRVQKLEDEVNSGVFMAFQENIRGDMNPDQIAAAYQQMLQAMRPLGKTPKELAGVLLQRLSTLSAAKNGDPSVFDVFDQPTDNGMTLLAANPELAPQVAAAREQARALNSRYLEEKSQRDNVPVLAKYNEDLLKNPESITLERVMNDVGKHSVFATTEQAAAMLARAQAAIAEKKAEGDLNAAFLGGLLGRYEPEVQRKVLESQLGGFITETWMQAVNGDPNAAQALATRVMQAQSQSNATVPVEALKRLVDSTWKSMANATGPDSKFEAVASLYRTLSADNRFRDLYFTEDMQAVFREYTQLQATGSDPTSAYRTAMELVSPEAKARAEAMLKSPEFKDKVASVHKEVLGSSWVPTWLGGNGRVVNQLSVEVDAKQAAEAYLRRNPQATPESALEYAKGWVSKNYVMDEASGSAIKVPPGLADDTTRKAISEYSKRISEAYQLSNRSDGTWTVQYHNVGQEGLVNVVLSNGSAMQNMGVLDLRTLRDAFVAEDSFSEPERAVLRQLQQQARAGAFDPAFLDANDSLLVKAKRLKGLPEDTLKRIEKTRADAVKARLDAIPKFSMGTPTLDSLQYVPTRGVKVDNKLTAQVAKDLFGNAGSPHQARAASLITMGEAVMLKAYDDPAQGAGKNIGMGYNLKANAATAREDLKRAGVPEDRVQAVIDGTAQLTPQQASRLLLVSLPRYEKKAMDVANRVQPGLWERMTAGQRAVMVDVAYQVGDVSQFRKAWDALVRGDAAAFAEETKVTYVDRNGVRKEDKRRNDLRAAMLNGDSMWLAAVDKYGGFPSNAMEAYALNQPN